MRKTKQIRLQEEVYNRLINRARYDQSVNGVIKELLDIADGQDVVPHTLSPRDIVREPQNKE